MFKNQKLASPDVSLCTEENLQRFLKQRNSFTVDQQQKLKDQIDNSSKCWQMWNKVRWDAAMNSQGVQELKEYLGKKFIPYYDSSWGLAEEWNALERKSKELVEDFYRKTSDYMYNSIIFYNSGDRDDLHSSFNTLKEHYQIATVIDYGCGTGNDGLKMIEGGTKVIFVDFQSPTFEFLQWRLARRGISSDMYELIDLDAAKNRQISADLFWSVDVIEHMYNPLDIFLFINKKTKFAAHFTDADDTAGGRHPFHFKINKALLKNEFKNRNFIELDYPLLNVWKRMMN